MIALVILIVGYVVGGLITTIAVFISWSDEKNIIERIKFACVAGLLWPAIAFFVFVIKPLWKLK